jgi:hypothetical protein
VPRIALDDFGEYGRAAFYVLAGQADFCRRVLAEAGLSTGILDDDEIQK